MDDVVMVPIPVSPEAAEALADEDRRAKVGKLVSDLLHPSSTEDDPLSLLVAEARADGSTDEAIDASSPILRSK
jgi:hypothetical protein